MTNPNLPIIEITDLRKYFKEVKAVDGVTFSVREGELFAFLGENGAGKSTTISVISGDLKKDSGSVKISGYDLDDDLEKIKPLLGIVFQTSVLDKPLSVYDNLKNRASLYGIVGTEFENRFQELSLLLELEEIKNRPLSKLSGGQKRRVDIARAIIHKPKILILDEPTTGLDPMTRKKVWDVVDGLRKELKMTVFLTTHYMEEASMADYIVIIDKGIIAEKGTPLELKNNYTGDAIFVYNVLEEDIISLGVKYEKIKNGFKILVKDTKTAQELILKNPSVFNDFEIVKGKMDDVFLAVTGKKIGDKENENGI